MAWTQTLEEKFSSDPQKIKSAREAEKLVKAYLEGEGFNVVDYEADRFVQQVVGVDLAAWSDDQRAIGVQVKDNLKCQEFIVEIDTVKDRVYVNRYYHVNTNGKIAVFYRSDDMVGYLERAGVYDGEDSRLNHRIEEIFGKRCIRFGYNELHIVRTINLDE